MNYQIKWTRRAETDIRRIVLGIGRSFGKETALQKAEEIRKKTAALSAHPYMGVVPRSPQLIRQRFRVLIVNKNYVLYKVDEDEKTVMIYALIDQRQDYHSVLFELT